MNITPEETLQKELAEGEEILWTGRPDHKKIFKKSDIIELPLNILLITIFLLFIFNVPFIEKIINIPVLKDIDFISAVRRIYEDTGAFESIFFLFFFGVFF